jgi:hypothetical protein
LNLTKSVDLLHIFNKKFLANFSLFIILIEEVKTLLLDSFLYVQDSILGI